MKKSKQSFLTDSVKAYLQMKIARSGLTPVSLGSERELALRFNIARQTIHPAILELIEEGWCMYPPHKRTLYSNPEKAIPENRNIGLFSGNLYSSSFHSMPTMSGIFSAYSDLRTFVHFSRLYSDSFEKLIDELEKMEFDGLLFATDGGGQLVPFVKRLIADGIPTVVFSSQTTLAKLDLPAENYEPFDYERSLQNRAKLVKKGGYKKIFMTSSDDSYFSAFNRYFDDQLERANFNTDRQLLPKQLIKALDTYKPDLLIADGGSERYRTFFQVLNTYSGKVPDLMLSPMAQFCHPEIDEKYHVQYIDDNALEFKRGLRIAKKLSRLMNLKNRETSKN